MRRSTQNHRPRTASPTKRLARFEARRDVLVASAQCRQRLFVPTPGDAWQAFTSCFASVTGSSEKSSALTDTGDGTVDWSYRVDLNEYEHGSTLLLPGDVVLGFGSRDDIVAPPACEISMMAATQEAAAQARTWLVAAGAPLLPLVITTIQKLEPPEISERWESRDWSCLVSSMKSNKKSPEPIHQIYVPNHDVGPFMGRETDCASDHPELVTLIASLLEDKRQTSSGDFRFASRTAFDKVCEALLRRLLCR